MIDTGAVSHIFAVFMGMWAMGYAIGKAMAWVRQIQNIA